MASTKQRFFAWTEILGLESHHRKVSVPCEDESASSEAASHPGVVRRRHMDYWGSKICTNKVATKQTGRSV